MTTKKTAPIFILLLIAIVPTARGLAQKRSPLSSEQQKELLSRRLPSGAVTGTFGAFGSLLHAALNLAIHTNDKQIADSELHSPFPEFYKPTIGELLDTIAMQTQSSWSYDPQNDYWVFAKPAKSKSFSITLADKWTTNDRGVYVSYKPPTYPVGMDIYYYGSYSADDPKQQAALWKRIRNSWAIAFASRGKRDVTVEEMRSVTVDGVDALYFQLPTPRPGAVWRQWAFVKNGHAFMIVSTLPENDEQLRSDVEAMVKSFRLTS